jgi:hypothetical protein
MSTYVLTKEQRAALKRVFDRQALTLTYCDGHARADRWENYAPSLRPKMTYRQFRRLVVESFDCIMVPWCGMWLGIEKDGYTHS